MLMIEYIINRQIHFNLLAVDIQIVRSSETPQLVNYCIAICKIIIIKTS